MDQNNEKPIILAVVTVFLAFTLIYLIFLRSGSSTSLEYQDEWWSWTIIDNTFSWSSIVTWTSSISTNDRVDLRNLSWSQSTWLSTPLPKEDIATDKTISSFDMIANLRKKIDGATGLSLRYNSIKMAEILALDIKVAFSDSSNIQYGYLWTWSIDTITQIVNRLWWNIVAIETENDINTNNLRWDLVLFINIPQVTLTRTNGTEKRLLVAMIVEISNDKRLIQAPFDRYHASKSRMKQIFEQLYGKML